MNGIYQPGRAARRHLFPRSVRWGAAMAIGVPALFYGIKVFWHAVPVIGDMLVSMGAL